MSLLHSHYALVLLKNSLAMPKLLYTLRTSDCSDSPLLAQFDSTLRAALSAILNDDQWAQASFPVSERWSGNSKCSVAGTFSLFGIGCIYTRAPTVHPPSEHPDTGRQIHRDSWDLLGSFVRSKQESLGWSCISRSGDPYPVNHFQWHGQGKALGRIIPTHGWLDIGDWLHAPPIASAPTIRRCGLLSIFYPWELSTEGLKIIIKRRHL